MTSAHDRLFRYLFSIPAHAAALLRHNLPRALAAQVDWSTLRRESGTLVDWGRETRKDLLFSARLLHSAEDEPPLFFIIEHQSKPDRWMAVRLLDYVSRLILYWRRLHPQNRFIPQVIALVVYPRRGRRWAAPLRLEDLYSLSTQSTRRQPRWAVRFESLLDDLSPQSDRAVRSRPGPPVVTLGLLMLCYAGTGELAKRLPHWEDLFAQVYTAPEGLQTLNRLVRYLHQLGDEQVHAAVNRVLHSIMEPERAEKFMRTMEQILKERGRAEGKAEGLAKGEARGLAKAVLLLLAAKGVRVDTSSRRRIQRCTDVAKLELWHRRAVTASRISEVLDGPA